MAKMQNLLLPAQSAITCLWGARSSSQSPYHELFPELAITEGKLSLF